MNAPTHPTPLPGRAPEKSQDAAAAQPLCPLCQGRLVRLRDNCRCQRCGFVLCVGCAEGEG